ncbi:hypothetical protein JM664_11075 [Rhodobacteraceae bacterium MCCB 386]|nr:hypothetical protein [Roseitranquillus sediminis]
MFKRAAAAGVGRPVDKSGFPSGPWTPERLAEAISQIDANRSGIELRTVQLWFQDNEKGISSDNIRWLARIFGCDDPEATGEWQAELSASQSRLTAKRRQRRRTSDGVAGGPPQAERPAPSDEGMAPPAETPQQQDTEESGRGFSIAQRSEAFFSRGSLLDLPASVFAGAVALQFLSYFLGIHSVTYVREDGAIKQVGFLWAPNWTLLFMIFMPLFLAFAVELLAFWRDEGRPRLLTAVGSVETADGWARKVEASSYTYWAVFLICVGFAGLFQWISVRLIPLLSGNNDYAVDWGSLTLVQPDAISIPQSIAFTGVAYLYMCLCFYLFFAGLILLFTVVHDLYDIERLSDHRSVDSQAHAAEVGHRIMRGIFRCTLSGILIAICMKLQAFYVTTDDKTILHWLVSDALTVLAGADHETDRANYSMPTHYTSLLTALASCIPFLYGSVRIRRGGRFSSSHRRMTLAVALLVAGYLLIGAFPGFAIFLGVAVLIGTYGLFDPAFSARSASEPGDDRNVS